MLCTLIDIFNVESYTILSRRKDELQWNKILIIFTETYITYHALIKLTKIIARLINLNDLYKTEN